MWVDDVENENIPVSLRRQYKWMILSFFKVNYVRIFVENIQELAKIGERMCMYCTADIHRS